MAYFWEGLFLERLIIGLYGIPENRNSSDPFVIQVNCLLLISDAAVDDGGTMGHPGYNVTAQRLC